MQKWEAATSDVYSTRLDKRCLANPIRLNQSARNGDNMAGIFVAAGSNNYREYLRVPLTEALAVGVSYCAEMYILLRSDIELASNNIGMYFSETRITHFDGFTDVLHYLPQVNEEQVVTSKDRWHKISGCFVAETAAKYLLIGNFFDLANTDTTFLADRGDFMAYYFVDDVLVEEIAPLPLSVLGNDTLLCPGEVLALNAQTPGATYQWDNFSTEATRLVEQADTYWVDITVGSCTIRDSIIVTYEPPLNLGTDTLLCEGEVLRAC